MERYPLTDVELQTKAPSIFASSPRDTMSEKYKFVRTIDVVNAFRDSNVHPVFAAQSRAMTADRREYTRHVIRFNIGMDE